MKNENVLIFGDSYSTFEGYIPKGYAVYYTPSSVVETVDKTWWKLLEAETNSKIILNNSWSGSTICNTGYEGDCSKTSSFIHRLDVLKQEGFFENKIDRVFVFGGTNDSWSDNKLGDLIYGDWKEEDLFLVLPGMCYFIDKLIKTVGKEKIFVIINCDIKDEIIEAYEKACKHYGVNYVKLKDIDKIDGHPTSLGMLQIKDQIIENI